MTQVNCSFTSTFNNDYHYELPICALKKKTNCKATTKKTNYTEFSLYAKTIDNGDHNKNDKDNDIDNNNNYNCNKNNTYDRKLIKKKQTTNNKSKQTRKKNYILNHFW